MWSPSDLFTLSNLPYVFGELLVLAIVYNVWVFATQQLDDEHSTAAQLVDEHGHVSSVGDGGSMRIQVVVLGDIGRSPRMQYHAISLAKHGAIVEVIGYNESDMHPDMTHPNISILPLPPPPKSLQTSNKLLFLLLAPVKVLLQLFWLIYILAIATSRAKFVLVQNPPSIPTLAIAGVVCLIRRTSLVIDWHNFGYSILALKLGSSHPLVTISKWYERVFGRLASANFAVTNAMCRVLEKDFRVTAVALHDRPPKHFQPLTAEQRCSFLQKLPLARGIPQGQPLHEELVSGKTRLVVSATSWTADEDFSIFLEALTDYSARVSASPSLPQILAVITGKGPQKQHYLDQISALEKGGRLTNVRIKTAWLSMPDYASLLGAADLGVSLHTSSSGVDLPMKVVDMFGAGLPVLGWSRFEAWPELVVEGVNGRGFGSASELADGLVSLFAAEGKALGVLRKGALLECERRWDDEWDPIAGRVFGVVGNDAVK